MSTSSLPTSLDAWRRHPGQRPAIDATARYLRVLTALAPAHALLDIRYRTRNGSLSRFFTGVHARGAASVISRIGQRTDIYVGCAPRLRRAGGRDAVAATALLWVDCDTPAAVHGLERFTPAPSMIIASGTAENVHAYWALDRTLDVPALEKANRRLAAYLGADPRCADAARILRPPGTHNHKHVPPRPVLLREHNAARYAPAEILTNLPPRPSSPPPGAMRRDQRRGEGDPLLAIAPDEYVRTLTGRSPGRDHKIACPLHKDRTPSFHVYDTPQRGWRCYGCNRGGSIYDLASALWDIPPYGHDFLDLRARLDALFAVTRG